MKAKLLLLFGCLFRAAFAPAQVAPAPLTPSPGPKGSRSDGLLFRFDESGDQFLKMNLWLQTWFRGIENNPGTAVNGDPQSWTLDAGIRRMRIQLYGQLSPRFLLMLQMGINNQTFASGGGTGTGAAGVGKKAPFFFHDAYGQFNILQDKDRSGAFNRVSLSIGAGLHSWNGVSRLTNASTISLLTADAPVFNWPTVEVSDQFTRQFGIFAKGYLGRVAYRASVNKPFMTSIAPPAGGAAVDNNRGNQLSYQAYAAWQFRDQEEIQNAFYAGSYYGRKKVFNVGAGFLHASKTTASQPVRGEFRQHGTTCLGLDVFYDAPVGPKAKDMAVTFYSAYYNYNFGPDYLRISSLMNPGTTDSTYTGTRALEGPGTGRVLLGTGHHWYTQAAFLLPKFSRVVRVQPYVSYSYKSLEALNQPGHFYNAGGNFLFDGNRARISLEYSRRPLYAPVDRKIFRGAGEVLASVQFWL